MSNTRSKSRGRTLSGRPNPVDIHVGERLRLRRMVLGLSQDALACLLGLTFQQIQKYESGANRVGASRLYDLARALDVSVDYFYDEMNEQVKQASPRHLAKLETEPELPPVLAVNSRETLDLIRVYYRINDPSVRRRVHDLARALGVQLERHAERGRLSPESDGSRQPHPDPGE
ncbi:helix-turn-helix domain-containing protein [Magnetospirillum fulvum]|uniref:Transcriptional regulator, contains XRE-family HTH domain n=1 Tax=Magnetospirillum fulvum TaxID=1082 RepID=A0A1H6GPE8_MAGFU|nr:helix-turn-helix transcriptional regulator [Magnetospirillum fulvum]SEH25257.1 Transcriptional regulator, contains XRE-family HTH domain [Magnetospirillum fulvum]